MKIQVITSGDSFSTADVGHGLIAGLRANGCEVLVSELSDALDTFSGMVEASNQAGLTYPAWAGDAFALAAPRIIAQAAWSRPDAVIAVTGLKLHFSVPLTIRKLGIPVALLCTESPYEATEREIASMYDHVFTNERSAVPLFGAHPSVQYLAHAFNPDVHCSDGPKADPCDVFFVGTAFQERRDLFGGGWPGVDFRLIGAMWQEDAAVPLTSEAVRSGLVAPWEGIVHNHETVTHYRAARINLNHHRTTTSYGSGGHIAHAESLGPRAYEIAACGAFQLCDAGRAELHDVFGDTVPTYDPATPASLEREIRYWLSHDDRREALARTQHEAVQPHTWHARARQMLERIL